MTKDRDYCLDLVAAIISFTTTNIKYKPNPIRATEKVTKVVFGADGDSGTYTESKGSTK